jgi:hypothetical protein
LTPPMHVYTMTMAPHVAAEPVPKTLSKEWQDATKENMKEKGVNPVTGISSK